MKKFKIKISKPDAMLYTLAFTVPVLIMLIILNMGGFYPFGDKTMFIMDMRDQYLEFFASLRNIVSGDDSLFFSWSRSMGGNYLGLFAYYIASPLSFITLFFSIKNLTAAIVVLTLLKLGLCSLSFAVYGNYLRKRAHASSGFFILIFAVSYSLISYNMVYSLCPMWLDGVILLPAILLGVEKILDGKKGLHYTLALTALFISNYYTGYMVGIFTALYMVYRLLCEFKKGKSEMGIKSCGIRILRFTGATFLALGMSAPLILPVVRDLMQGKLSTQNYRPDITTNFENITDLFGKLTNGVYDSITNVGLPAVYCGYLALLLAVVFFFLRKISIREKIGAAVILLFFALSFYNTELDIAWHGFQYPNWFPYRYAFLSSFFILYMGVRACTALPETKLFSKQWQYAALLSVLTLLVSFDMGYNGSILLDGLDKEFRYSTVEDYESFIDKTKPLVDEIQANDDGFYRINQGFEYSKNDAMLLGYNGMTHYSSTFNAAVNSLTPKLGIAQSHMWNSGYGSTPMLDSLFAVKYILADRQVSDFYKKIEDSPQGTSSYLNDNALPIAYSAPADTLTPNLDTYNTFVNQNTFLNGIAGSDISFFTEYSYATEQTNDGWQYTFTADSENPIYLYMNSSNGSWANVYVNDNWVGNYFSTETSCTLYLGTFSAGQNVTVRVVPNQPTTVDYAMIARLDTDKLKQVLDGLKQNGMKITSHAGGHLSGTIYVPEGQKILTSIPYDAGWRVTIDGREAELQTFADTFLTLEAAPGDHEIEFSYVSPGFKTGMLLFVIALLAMLLYFGGWQFIRRKIYAKKAPSPTFL